MIRVLPLKATSAAILSVLIAQICFAQNAISEGRVEGTIGGEKLEAGASSGMNAFRLSTDYVSSAEHGVAAATVFLPQLKRNTLAFCWLIRHEGADASRDSFPHKGVVTGEGLTVSLGIDSNRWKVAVNYDALFEVNGQVGIEEKIVVGGRKFDLSKGRFFVATCKGNTLVLEQLKVDKVADPTDHQALFDWMRQRVKEKVSGTVDGI